MYGFGVAKGSKTLGLESVRRKEGIGGDGDGVCLGLGKTPKALETARPKGRQIRKNVKPREKSKRVGTKSQARGGRGDERSENVSLRTV